MAAPVATVVAQAAGQLLQRARQLAQPPPERRGPLGLIATVLLGVVVLACLAIVAILGGAQLAGGCTPDEPIAGTWTGPGSLGGIQGTGVSAAELAAARRIPGVGGTRLTPGTYSPTAYFPHPSAPSTNCAATCLVTASGIRVNNARRRAYLIASNPRLNQYGALAYIWPNPYGWRGPFVVADTGSAFAGSGRLDFYIFQDTAETWQQALARAYQWGPANHVQVSSRPIVAGGPSIATPTATETGAGAGDGAVAGCDVVLDPELGARIGQIAARHVGSGPSIPGFAPPTTDLAWCAWFMSNVWRQAGVPIDITWFSGAPYAWAQQHNTLWKALAQPAPSVTPPLGAALMYGSGPQSAQTSEHINLVSKLNPDGSFMTIGGNESNRVMLSGPCRLTRGPETRLQGPGCDTRPVYAIAAPGVSA